MYARNAKNARGRCASQGRSVIVSNVTQMPIDSCPFCGGQASVRLRTLPIMMATDIVCLYLVRCHECGAEGPEFVTESWSIRAWNRRGEMEGLTMTEFTYGDLIKMLKERNRDLGGCIGDYRPAMGECAIQVWLIDGTTLYARWIPEIKGFVIGGKDPFSELQKE